MTQYIRLKAQVAVLMEIAMDYPGKTIENIEVTNCKIMKVYISGKIGENIPSEKTMAKFRKAEDFLKKKGYDVFNPTTCENVTYAKQHTFDYSDKSFYKMVLSLDLIDLSHCDAVMVLEDWHDSPGSKVEIMFAQSLNIPILEEGNDGQLKKVRIDAKKY